MPEILFNIKTNLIVIVRRFLNNFEWFSILGADGSARLFDLRNLQHSTIVYEDPLRTPLMRLAWNKQDSHYLATFAQDSAEVSFIVDAVVMYEALFLSLLSI